MASRVLPFPFAINIGTDICQISRIYSILRSERGPRFVQRVLAPEEQSPSQLREPVAWILSTTKDKFDPTVLKKRSCHLDSPPICAKNSDLAKEQNGRDPRIWEAAQFIAGRFAAKEAAIKAHPHRRLTFHGIVIARRHAQRPFVLVDAKGRENRGPPVAIIKGDGWNVPDQEAMISISHDGDYATAVCLGSEPGHVCSKADTTRTD